MSNSRIANLNGSITCCIFALLLHSSKAQTPYTTKTFTGNVNQVVSRTNGGDIFVTGNASLSQHKVEIYVKSNDGTKLSNDEIQQRLDTYYTVKIGLENGVLNATAIRNENINVPSNQQLSISFVIGVASETVSTELNTGGGNLIVRRIFGNIKGQTFGGNAEATNCGGENNVLDLSTNDGDFNLNNLTGTITAWTSDGNVIANTLTGNIIVSTLNGNLNLYDVSGALSATCTLGGNIVASMTKVTGDTRLMTYSGNVDFSFPSGHYNLTFIGNKVDVSGLSNFNGTQTQETKKLVNGQLNGGGTEVYVSGNSVIVKIQDGGSTNISSSGCTFTDHKLIIWKLIGANSATTLLYFYCNYINSLSFC